MRLAHCHYPNAARLPILLSAPHGGREIPADLRAASPLSVEQLLETSDFWTDTLVSAHADLAYISAVYARTLVDLNRGEAQLDWRLIEGAPRTQDPYVSAGYGVIPRFAAPNHQIRNARLSSAEAEALLATYHRPFHASLAQMINQLHAQFGWVLLLDVHTAPARAMNGVEIVLGTVFGRSIASDIAETIAPIFARNYSFIAHDNPFSGGYIAQKYGKPRKNIHVLQIEISRDLVERENRALNQDFFNTWQLLLENIIYEIDAELSGKIAAE